MTLPTSGPISLDAIAGEFGGAVPHSINEYYKGGGLVPNTAPNASIPTSGQVSFSNYYGGQAGGGAWSAYGPAFNSTTAVGFDSSGNVYFGGVGRGVASAQGYINVNKATLTGTTIWKKEIVTSSEIGAVDVYGIGVDSGSNVYVAGLQVSGGLLQGYLGKFTSSGSTVFQKRLTGGSGVQAYFNDLKVSSSDEIYVTASFSSSDTINLLKLDTSGNIVWQRRLAGGGNNGFSQRLCIDSSGNVYVAGYLGSGTSFNAVLVKYNSSGVLQWQRRIVGAIFASVHFDSAGDVYAVGWLSFSAPRRPLIVKYNSSGTLQWQRTLANGGNTLESAVDVFVKSDNVFVLLGGIIPGTSTSAMLVANYSTSGTLTSQKYLSPVSVTTPSSMRIDNSNNIIVGGQKSGAGFVGILPSLMSATGGTALSVTLSSGSHTGATPTITANTPTYTASTPTLSLANSTATVADGAWTNTYAAAT